MVWGFIVPLDYENGFFPPLESTHIFEAYPQFENWVETGGNESNDWYTTPNSEKVFNKKL